MIRTALLCAAVSIGCGSQAPAGPTAHEPTPTDPIAGAYGGTASRIIAAALADDGAWTKLEHLTDRIGHRLSGSPALDRAIAWAAETMKADGHANVATEEVMVPHWERGAESARLVAPVELELPILGLGGTVATPPEGITADVVVVKTFEELDALGDAVRGKIVVYDAAMWPFNQETGSGYDQQSKYRVFGPSKAARYGAAAVLMRSLTAHSLRTPHTGTLWYTDDAPRIPAAAITTEDTRLITRLIAAGDTPRVTLKLEGHMLPDARSANVIGEIVGREKPEEVVVLGAHIDSWDVGAGAHDDGAGVVTMMQALTVLRRLGLQPRRTIRVVLFTNEENGGRGSKGYVEAHAAELANHVAGIESDSGGFAPRGFQLSGSDEALPRLKRIAALLGAIGATRAKPGYSGADVEPMEEHGVPGVGLWVDETHYFDYHHTQADTLDKVDPEDLAKSVAAVAVFAFVVADMPERLGQ